MFGKKGSTKLKFTYGFFLFLALVFVWSLSIGENSNVNKQSPTLTENEEYYMKTGNNLYLNGEFSKAIDNYIKAIELNPLSYYAAYNTALALEKLDLVREAIQAHTVAKQIRAKKDCTVIADALKKFHEDTGTWPFFNDCYVEGQTRVASVDFLYGNMGDMPVFGAVVGSSWGAVGADMYFSLFRNGMSGYVWYKPKDENGGWNGPYLPYMSEDPWGYKYLISVSGCEGGTNPENQVWCLSAGPNFYVSTPPWSNDVKADDIGVKVE